MYPNIQKAMTRNLKKSQKLVVFIGPVLFLYLFWWIWYSNGKVIDENNRGMLLLFAGMAVFLILSILFGIGPFFLFAIRNKPAASELPPPPFYGNPPYPGGPVPPQQPPYSGWR